MRDALDSLNEYFGEVKDDFAEIAKSYKLKNQLKLKSPLKNSQVAKNLSLLDFLTFRDYDAKNCLFENDKTIGFVMRASHFTGIDEASKQALNNFINSDLPPGCTLQVINYASPKIGSILDSWHKSGSKKDVFKKISDKRREFYEKGRFQSLLGKAGNLIVRDYELYFIFSMSKTSSEYAKQAAIYKLTSLKDKFSELIKELKSDVYLLNQRDFVNFLQELVNPSRSPYKNQDYFERNEKKDIRDYLQSSHNVEMQSDKIIFSDASNRSESEEKKEENEISYSVFEVIDWPSHWDLHAGIDYIGDFGKGVGLPCPFYISMGFTLDDRESSSRTADKHRMIKTQQNDSKLPMFFPKMLEENSDWRYASDLIGQGQRMGKMVMYIVLINFGLDSGGSSLERYEQNLKDHFSRLEFKISKVKYDTLNSFIYSLPFGIGENWHMLDQLKISSKKLSGACINLMPVFADSQNYTSPLMMFVGRRGQPFFFDNFKTADALNGNFNMVVVGASGRGKSVWLQEYTISLLKHGGQVVIIDDGRSFKNICELLDGDFVDFGGGDFCINPFSLYKGVDQNEEYKEYKEYFEEPFIDLVVSVLCIIINIDKNNTLDPEVGLYRSILTNAVVAVMSKKGCEGGFSDVRQEILANLEGENQEIKAIASKIEYILRSYSGDGRHAKYFNGVASIDINNRLTVFELSDLEKNQILQSSALLTVSFLVYAKIRGRNIPTALIIDEAWKTARHPVLKEPISGLCRRGRKYLLALIMASQCMSDFEAEYSEAAAVALSQADWRVILSVDGKDDKVLRDALDMSAAEIEITHTIMGRKGYYSEFMLRHKSKYWQIGRLLLDPFSAQTYSTKAEDVVEIRQMRKKGIPVDKAIENLMAIKNNNIQIVDMENLLEEHP